MTNPERGGVPEEQGLSTEFREWAIKELEGGYRKAFEEEKAGRDAPEEEKDIAEELETILAFVKDKDKIKDPWAKKEILVEFGFYVAAMKDYNEMKDLLERARSTAIDDKWTSNDKRFFMDGLQKAVEIAAKGVRETRKSLKRVYGPYKRGADRMAKEREKRERGF